MSRIEEKFWSKVNKSDGCWTWKGAGGSWGYGRFVYQGKKYIAHRFSVQIHGTDIPPGLVVDHMCRNRACVNPSHLRVVTPAINSVENSQSVSAKNSVKTHCKNGHAFDQSNTRYVNRGLSPRRYCRTCQRVSDHKYKARIRGKPLAKIQGDEK